MKKIFLDSKTSIYVKHPVLNKRFQKCLVENHSTSFPGNLLKLASPYSIPLYLLFKENEFEGMEISESILRQVLNIEDKCLKKKDLRRFLKPIIKDLEVCCGLSITIIDLLEEDQILYFLIIKF